MGAVGRPSGSDSLSPFALPLKLGLLEGILVASSSPDLQSTQSSEQVAVNGSSIETVFTPALPARAT